MSITSRARNLSRIAGFTHQQSVNTIRSAGKQTRDLAAEANWQLSRADVFLADPMLDEEYKEAWQGSRSVQPAECNNCSQRFFVGYDKKGYSDGPFEFCPECREEHGLDHCPKCGTEVLGSCDGVCEACWDQVLAKD